MMAQSCCGLGGGGKFWGMPGAYMSSLCLIGVTKFGMSAHLGKEKFMHGWLHSHIGRVADPHCVAQDHCSFLPRNCISAVLAVGWCLSVCPFVTFVYCIQTTRDIVRLLLHLVAPSF